MSDARADYVVVIDDDREHRRPFGPARDRVSAEDVARRLRAWRLDAKVLRGSVDAGEFVPAASWADPADPIGYELYMR